MVYIHSFHYSAASNGIKITYELARKLNEMGICAKNLCFDPYVCGAEIPFKYLKNTIFCSVDQFPDIEPDDIVIYPEHVSGNPLNATCVVRYLLNKPYYIFGYGIEYAESDYILSYSQLISETLPYLYILVDERKIYANTRRENPKKKNVYSVYFGKCNPEVLKNGENILREMQKKYKSVNVITRQYPERKSALRMIAESDMMVSFDPLSNLNYEATLLGTPVLMLDDSFNTSSVHLPAEQCGYFYNINDLERAKLVVKESYNCYCNYFMKQDKIIKDTYKNWIHHFELCSKPEYLRANAERNRRQKETDYKQFLKKQKVVFIMIATTHDIPQTMAEILKL